MCWQKGERTMIDKSVTYYPGSFFESDIEREELNRREQERIRMQAEETVGRFRERKEKRETREDIWFVALAILVVLAFIVFLIWKG